MLSYIRKFIDKGVRTEWFWNGFQKLILPTVRYTIVKRDHFNTEREFPSIINRLLNQREVLHGPFAGMRYPEAIAVGSVFAPKIIGSYEGELHDVIEEVCRRKYSKILDIGCAEGYYAVGFARRTSGATVYAFDISEKARALCRAMAELNGVSDRVVIDGACDSSTFLKLAPSEKALILCDCEGFEKKLFSKEVLPLLAKHDILIEIHDFIDLEISTYLSQLFEESHSLTIINSFDDNVKVRKYQFPELDGLSLAEKRIVLREGRPCGMEWFYLTPKQVS